MFCLQFKCQQMLQAFSEFLYLQHTVIISVQFHIFCIRFPFSVNILKFELRISADLCFCALRNVLCEKQIDEHFSHPHFNDETFYANRLSKHSWENLVCNQNLYFIISLWLKNVSQKSLWKVADVLREWKTGFKSM